MRRLIASVLAAALLGGCATYVGPVPPVPPAPGVYVEPPPVVVAPGPVWWPWHGGWWHGHWRR